MVHVKLRIRVLVQIFLFDISNAKLVFSDLSAITLVTGGLRLFLLALRLDAKDDGGC